MADGTTISPGVPTEAAAPSPEQKAKAQPRPKPRGPPLSQIYTLPAPIRTFPLPSFYPNNPISLLHLVYAWVKQVLSPPPAEPSVIHTGVWDPQSRSVHITDARAVRALWEQGFYGKGSLSRSEPNWLKREQIRRGAVEGDVSEQRTALRREERRQVKWERARNEQEALERTRREEAQLAGGGGKTDAPSVSPAPLGFQAESELLTSRLEPSGVSQGAGLPQASPASTGVELVTSFTNAPEEALFAHGPPPVEGCTLVSPVADHSAQPTPNDVSPGAISLAAVTAEAPMLWKAPVGPLELLALPDSSAALRLLSAAPLPRENILAEGSRVISRAPVGPLELLALPNSVAEMQPRTNAVVVPLSGSIEASSTLESGNNSDQASPSKSPVGPLELLALPNSIPVRRAKSTQVSEGTLASESPVNPSELRALPDPHPPLPPDVHSASVDKSAMVNGTYEASDAHRDSETRDPANAVSDPGCMNGTGAGEAGAQTPGHTHSNGHIRRPIFGVLPAGPVISELAGSKRTVALAAGPVEQPPKRRRKSVRFSTTVESTTFLHHEPPSPGRTALVGKCNGDAGPGAGTVPREAVQTPVEASAPEDLKEVKDSLFSVSSETAAGLDVTADIENKEHLQLSAEEAFFLSYGIGALSILDAETKLPIPREKLLQLFRAHSYFPPREDLRPNDPFLVHYAVYHHFRSLGWVPRHGIKFGVDWMLYTRGPVFDHAEFGLIVMPAYSHSWWRDSGVAAPRKSWHWLHGVNRVLSHVLKSLVLVYVDVPPPPVFDAAMAAGGVSAALKEYRVREFMVRRWSSNRNR